MAAICSGITEIFNDMGDKCKFYSILLYLELEEINKCEFMSLVMLARFLD